MKRFFVLSDVCEIINAINASAAIALFQMGHPKMQVRACLQMAEKH